MKAAIAIGVVFSHGKLSILCMLTHNVQYIEAYYHSVIWQQRILNWSLSMYFVLLRQWQWCCILHF